MTKQKTMDEWLRMAYEEAGDCPPPEIFLEAEWQKLGREERQLAERHSESCPACAAERDLAQAFDLPVEWTDQAEEGLSSVLAGIRDDDVSATDSGSGAADRSRLLRFPSMATLFSGPALGLAAAAIALLAVGLVVQTRSLAPPELPEAPVNDVTRGGRIDIVAPTGELDEIPELLRWGPVEGATRYEVTLSAVDETVIWKGASSTDRVTLPSEVRSAVQPAVVYFWQVEAFDSAGSRIAWSAATRFLVANIPIEDAS